MKALDVVALMLVVGVWYHRRLVFAHTKARGREEAVEAARVREEFPFLG